MICMVTTHHKNKERQGLVLLHFYVTGRKTIAVNSAKRNKLSKIVQDAMH